MQTEAATRIFLRPAGSTHEIVDNEANTFSSDHAETHGAHEIGSTECASANLKAPETGVDGNRRLCGILGMLPSENSAGASTTTTEHRARAWIACCTSMLSVLDR